MLLKSLLAAVAATSARRKAGTVRVPPTPTPVTVESPHSLWSEDDSPARIPPPPTPVTVAEQQNLPRDPALDAIYGSDDAVLEEFLARPVAEQMATIEDELSKLPDHEKRLIIEILRKELDRKWIPQPVQARALRSEADILLYGGSAGGGKSDLLLGAAITEHKRSLIMRREYDDLSYLTQRAVEINRTRNGFAASPHPVLRTEDGRQLEFRAAQRAGDEQKRQGQPVDFLGVDEAAQLLEGQVRYLFGWLRSTDPEQRKRVILASNPPLSDEGQWLVQMFRPWLDPHHHSPAKAGELRWYVSDEEGKDKEVEGPGPHPVGARMVFAQSRTFIPARLEDNAYLTRDNDYATQLDNLHEPLRSAMRDGNFMAVRSDDVWQVIPSEWIRLAQARWTPKPPEKQGMTCVSVDSAGGGKDAAVIAARYGTWFAQPVSETGPQTADGRYIGARVLMQRRSACQVVVDVGGGYGGEIVTTLKDNDTPVIGFKGSDASMGKAIGSNLEFANKRAEVWWRFREALDPQSVDSIALPPDAELAADLATPRLNARAMQRRGVIQVEDKEEIRARLGRSPDKGDAVVVCNAYGGLLELQKKEHPKLPRLANVGHANMKRRIGAR